VTDLTVAIIKGYHCYQLHTKCFPLFFSEGYLSMQTRLLEMAIQLLIRYSVFVICLRRKWEYDGSVQ